MFADGWGTNKKKRLKRCQTSDQPEMLGRQEPKEDGALRGKDVGKGNVLSRRAGRGGADGGGEGFVCHMVKKGEGRRFWVDTAIIGRIEEKKKRYQYEWRHRHVFAPQLEHVGLQILTTE